MDRGRVVDERGSKETDGCPLTVIVEEDNEMHVWQGPLLELNGENMSHRYPQSTLFDVIHDGSHLCSEDI
jgi:hypothetical protein